MIVYGAVASVSVGALFISGIGAGIVFGTIYILYCYTYARVTGLPRTRRATLAEIGQAAREVVWGLGMPVIILGGIYGGIFTPTRRRPCP